MTVAVMLLAGTALLAGCGVRGSLDTPPDPRGPDAATATADAGQGKAEGASGKPHKSFVLDGLLR